MRQLQNKKKIILFLIISSIPFLSGIGISFLPFIKEKMITLLISAFISLVIGFITLFRSFIKLQSGKSVLEIAGQSVRQLACRIAGRIGFPEKNIFRCPAVTFKRRYLKALVSKYRNYQTNGNELNAGLDLLDVHIPLYLTNESAEKIIPNLSRGAQNRSIGNRIWDFISLEVRDFTNRHLLITAGPGAGKTTLLEHIAYILSGNLRKQLNTKVRFLLPVLIDIKHISRLIAAGKSPSIEKIICLQEFIKKAKPNPAWFKKNLAAGKCLVMLDGLDGAGDRELRKKTAAWINTVMLTYPASRFIITTRPFGYKDNPLQCVDTILQIRSLDMQETECFIRGWYASGKKKESPHKAIDETHQIEAGFEAEKLLSKLRRQNILNKITANPLILAMLVSLHDKGDEIPTNLFALYQHICDVLLVRQKQETPQVPDREQNYAILKSFALRLMIDNRKAFDFDYWDKAVAKDVAHYAGDSITTRKLLDVYVNECGIFCAKEYADYEFVHSSFQEFLAASEIGGQKKTSLLVAYLDDAFWHNTIKLYSCQYNITELIRLILKAPSLPTLTLAYECIMNEAAIDADTKEKIDIHLLSRVHSKNIEISRLGAEYKLAKRCAGIRETRKNIFFDDEYISAAEYQLFIDDMYSSNKKDYRPGHRKTRLFPQKEGDKPVMGLLPDDAAAFCQWLSERGKGAVLYRLPSVNELSWFTQDKDIKIWHTHDNGYGLSPLTGNEIAEIKTKVENHLLPESGFIFAGIKDFLLTINSRTGNDFAQTVHYSLTHPPCLFRDININIDPVLDRTIDLARTRSLHQSLIMILDLFNILDRSLSCLLAPGFSKGFDLNHSLAIDLGCSLDISRDRITDESDIHRRIEFYFVRIKNRLAEGNPLDSLNVQIIINLLVIYLFLSLEEICSFSLVRKKPRTIANYKTQISLNIPKYMNDLFYLIILDLRIKGGLEPLEGLKIVGEKTKEK